MESFISDADKLSMGNEFYNVHATFGRPIVIFKTAEETVVSTNPEHNFLFNNSPTNDITVPIVQSGVFLARILYGKKEALNSFSTPTNQGASEQIGIQLKEGEVRIKLDPTGAAFLEGCERVTFDGTIFRVTTNKRPHGLFKVDFETFYLKALN
jgi:hypothetical protein